jgi:hypothetical protein
MDTGEDDLPLMFATPADEVEFWRTHTIDGKRFTPREPVKLDVREPDLRMTRPDPLPDLFDYLTYEEWKEGMDKCPALYWDPYWAVQHLMGRAYTPLRWR